MKIPISKAWNIIMRKAVNKFLHVINATAFAINHATKINTQISINK